MYVVFDKPMSVARVLQQKSKSSSIIVIIN